MAAPEAAPLRREVVVVLAIRNARDRDDAPARQALDGALVVVGAHLRAPVVRAGLAPLRVRAVPLLEAHEAAAAAAVVSPPAAGAVAAAVGRPPPVSAIIWLLALRCFFRVRLLTASVGRLSAALVGF